MKRICICLFLSLTTVTGVSSAGRPNIVFFELDDSNGWIRPLGCGQAVTPNKDRLATCAAENIFHHPDCRSTN